MMTLIDTIKELYPDEERTFVDVRVETPRDKVAVQVSAIVTANAMMSDKLNVPFFMATYSWFKYLTMLLVKFGMMAERYGWVADD